jgi:hypothetical protein
MAYGSAFLIVALKMGTCRVGGASAALGDWTNNTMPFDAAIQGGKVVLNETVMASRPLIAN